MKHFASRLFLAAALLVQPAMAQTTEQVTSAVGTVPFSAGQSNSFLYLTGNTIGFMTQAPTMQDIVEQNLINALAYAQNDPLSGVDFSSVTAVLSFGQSAERVTILFGAPGFATAAPETLARRHFEQRDIAGWTVFGLHEDGALDLNFNDPDPFATPNGRPQRLAISGTILVSTASWAKMEEVLTALEIPPPSSDLWLATLDGSRKAMAGQEPTSIMGFTTNGNPAVTPLSSISMLTFAYSEDGVTMVSASPYDSAESAELGARTIQERTGNVHPPGATVSIEVEPSPPHFIGMIKITEPTAQP